MKLVEIILLVGSHCVSPVEHMPAHTVVGKVPCAVMIHRESDTNQVIVIPATETGNPVVLQALARSGGGEAGSRSLTSQPADGIPFAEAAVIPSAKSSTAGIIEPIISEGKQDTLTDYDAQPAPSAVVNVDWPPQPDDGKPEGQPAAADELPAPDEAASAEGDAPADGEVVQDASEPAAEAEPAPAPAAAKPSKSRKTKSTSTATNGKIAQQTRNLKTVCRYPRIAKWYKNKSGRLKYRCVKSGKQGVY